MLLKDAKFVGAYHFTSKKKDKDTGITTEKNWTSVCFELPSPEHSIGTIYKDLLMDRDRVPQGLKDHIGDSCIVDYMNNFCNEILFN